MKAVAEEIAGPFDAGTQARGTHLARRRRWAVLIAVSAASVAVGGIVASSWVQSPAQAAADTRPPEPSVVTAPVEQKVLRSTTVLRGTFSNGRTIAAHPTSVAATGSSPPPSMLVVTGVFTKPGKKATAGKALLEYSGRPVFALPGSIPAYRDLSVGNSGKDVTQLQQALQELGYSTGPDASGRFGTGTARALKRLYQGMGYPVPVTFDTEADASTANRTSEGDAKQSGAGASGNSASGGTEAVEPSPGSDPPVSAPKPQPTLPASEVVYVPTLPARVVSVPVQVGDTISDPVLTLARGEMTLTGRLGPAQADLVSEGMAVKVLSETTGTEQKATVHSIGPLTTPAGADRKTGNGDDGPPADSGPPHIPLAIKPEQPWDTRLAGQDVRITITAAATDGPVLAVPTAAISAGADTRTTVSVVTDNSEQRTVAVKVGASADGMVAVTPLNGSLKADDRVVVGQ